MNRITTTIITSESTLDSLPTRIRSMQLKRATRENRERQTPSSDNATLFCPGASGQNDNNATPFTYYFPRGMPRIYRANPRTAQGTVRASSRARYVTCAQAEGTLTLGNQDKPPPYETAIQVIFILYTLKAGTIFSVPKYELFLEGKKGAKPVVPQF